MLVAARCPRLILILACCVLAAASCKPETPPQPKKSVKKSVRAEQPSVTEPAITERRAEPVVEPVAEPKAEPVEPTTQKNFRPADRRPKHDDDRLKQSGIGIYESTRLKLYTDIDPTIAETLTSVIDQVYPEWVANLGELPPDRNNAEFQITGYLIRDEALFRSFELVPPNLHFEHGLHSRNEFWMREQEFDYYRRHLLLHEATHCYMTFVPISDLPIWYLEGMAEYFASHRVDNQGHMTFGEMPTSAKEFAGFGRIPIIQADVAANRRLSIDEILQFSPAEFRSVNYYSWSWALCYFLDQSPRYQQRFRELSPLRNQSSFADAFKKSFADDYHELATAWSLFSSDLQYGYDIVRAEIDFREGTPLEAPQDERRISLNTELGWQSSGVRVEKGLRYRITAAGLYTLAERPKPWLSEPQGISIQYFAGRPIGQLVGCIRQLDTDPKSSEQSMLKVFSVGRELELAAPITGTLYFRINDAWNSLADDRGTVDITLNRLE